MNFMSSLLLTSNRRKMWYYPDSHGTYVCNVRKKILYCLCIFSFQSSFVRFKVLYWISRDRQFTSDSSIAFIAMGTTYFNQTEGFSLSLFIYYLFATPNILVFNFPYICLWFPYPFAWAVFWVLSLEMSLWQEINITIMTNLEEM